jgi:predicted AlkP superfamily phosphohydrolase/phosphomutase
MPSHRRKTLVLSIDSGCWAYLDPLLAAGRMPNVSRLIESGVRGVLESTMPPITPVAFSSFITGTNPGKHGVFGWLVRQDSKSSSLPASAAVRQGMPFWHYLNRAGVRVGLLNIPVTYLSRPLDGFLVAGLPVPQSARDYTYPRSLLDQIKVRHGLYTVDVPLAILEQGPDAYLAAWLAYEQRQTDIALELSDEYQVDVLALNYASLDRINHFSPYPEHLEQILVNVDSQIGRFVERYPEANFILMSDHGSRRIKSAFLLGKWLAQQGYAVYGEKSLDIPSCETNWALVRYFQAIRMNGAVERVVRNLLAGVLSVTPAVLRRPVWRAMYRRLPQALDYRFVERLDWNRTRVYTASTSGGLRINRRQQGWGRGTISEREYDSLRDALVRDLLAVKDPLTGKAVFSCVYRREELYQGPALPQAPDVVADHYNSTCDLVVDSDPGRFCFVNRLNRFGDHIRDGIFVLSGPDFNADNNTDHRMSIVNLPALLLHLYGVPIPEDFDGQVPEVFLRAGFREGNPVRFGVATESEAEGSQDLSEDEIAKLEDHLRALGYL